MGESYQRLYEIAQRNRRKQLTIGFVVLVAGVLCLALLADTIDELRRPLVHMAASACIFFGLYAIIHAIRLQKPDSNPILKSLKESPRNVVWVYAYITVNMPFGIKLFRTCYLYFNFRNGSRHYISIPADRHDEISEQLQDDLEHTTFGYTVQREQLFRVNPDMLYKD